MHMFFIFIQKQEALTKGKDWFNLPATKITDSVRHDLDLIRMRSALDTKRFYKKNETEAYPKYFQVKLKKIYNFYNCSCFYMCFFLYSRLVLSSIRHLKVNLAVSLTKNGSVPWLMNFQLMQNSNKPPKNDTKIFLWLILDWLLKLEKKIGK